MKTITELLHAEGYTSDCDDCKHHAEWTESHPYGEGTADEILQACRAPSDADCPRLLVDAE